MPHKRGPRRLTKLTETAAQHTAALTNQEVSGLNPFCRISIRKRSQINIQYDTKNFPPLTSRPQTQKSTVTPPPQLEKQPDASFEAIKTQLNTNTTKLQQLEQQLKAQQEQINQLTKTIDNQQQGIQKLTHLVKVQQTTTSQINIAIHKLTTSVTQLEALTTTILKRLPPHSSPSHEQVAKRTKVSLEGPSPSHVLDPLPIDTDEQDTWETSPKHENIPRQLSLPQPVSAGWHQLPATHCITTSHRLRNHPHHNQCHK